jgi:RecF/RecN/SMC N terminal domain.
MPSSLLDPRSNAEVRSFLTAAVPSANLTEATLGTEQQSLLLMRTSHIVAAFAFANGDVRQSYDALYGGFKRFYSDQRGEWDALDVAFVFCVAPEFSQLDGFCSAVETDVYFCRKFVVPLSIPVAGSLARLPFLPLLPLEGQSIRPPSAQTFLQQCGMPAVLAKYIVVQHERSAEGIVEDCSSGRFGDVHPLVASTAAPTIQSERQVEPVRIESITIQNFRAYRKPQTFALGSDVTVLYGPNGFGKTSFFDAIDFAITGGIGRIETRRQSDFSRTARHLDAGKEESAVTLTFRGKGAARTIVRTVNDRKQAVLDGRQTDRKGVLGALTGGNIPAADRVENFVSLFRASHLFSQEQQELTKDFADDCRLSAEIVSRMLAFEDYANAVNKLAGIRDVLQSAIADGNEALRELTEQIAADNKELERLGQAARTHTNLEAIASEIDALRASLVTVGVAIASDKPETATVRGWRASLESKHAQSRAMSDRLGLLAKELSGLPRIRSELVSVQKRIAEQEQILQSAEEKRSATELGIQSGEQRLAELTGKRLAEQSRADVLAWQRQTQPVYARLVAHKRELEVISRRETSALTELRTREAQATQRLKAKETETAQLTEATKRRRTERAAIQALLESMPAWEANRTRQTATLRSEQKLLATLEMARAAERELQPLYAAANAEQARLIRQIADSDKNQSELRALISQLEGHVQTGICPLCGDDHGSKDALLGSIQQHVARDAASGARGDLAGVRERVEQMAERLSANKQKIQSSEQERTALASERARLETEIAKFTHAAAKLAIALESAGLTPAEQAQAIATRLDQELNESEKLSIEAQAAVTAARGALTEVINEAAAKKAEVDLTASGIKRAQEELDGIRSDSRFAQLALETDLARVAELEEINLKLLEEITAATTKAEAEINLKKQELRGARQQVTSLKEQLATLRTQAGQLQKSIAQVASKLEEAGLPFESTEQTLLALIADQTRLQAHLLTLRDLASSLELAMDAATTAAALTTLREAVRNREKERGERAAQRDRYQPWLKYFDDASRLVASQQNDAIANFTRLYGPRTSVIQRRLRSVYGFDDIEMKSRDSTISVRVKRAGEELRPIDYFSQSQQQTLLLGLFLTACSSQTWSAFSPVFLDDPVTHFDDLNTYALLDLLVGLIDSKGENRQFVISTCDEKFLQLARQKFRHLDGRAKFYRFASIGAEGPTVAENG